MRVLQRRASNRVDVWEHDRYLRLLTLSQGLALVEVTNRGSVDEPDLRYSILTGPRSLAAHTRIRQTTSRILGLDVDPDPLQKLAEVDPALRPIVLSLRGMRPPRFAELFESFASVIPFQQLSLDAGISILGKLVERFGEHLVHRGIRYSAFPNSTVIAAAPLEHLQLCGLSLKKAQTLQQIARLIDAGELSEATVSAMDTNDALERLTQLPGVGPWTAGLVLLRGLGRTDVFPPGDAGAARRLRTLLKLEDRAPIDAAVARFGKRQGYLYFCCLGSSLLEKGSIRSALTVDS